MLSATAFLADGLDMVIEFLARSEAGAADSVGARYPSHGEWRLALDALARWSAGLPGAETIAGDEAGLSIVVPAALWQEWYARALSSGIPMAPDRIGLATLGAGGMPAALELVLEQAQRALSQQPLSWKSHPALAGCASLPAWSHVAENALLVSDWQALRDLLQRDALLRGEAQQIPVLAEIPTVPTERLIGQGFVLQRPGQAALLVCQSGRRDALLQTLSGHFHEHVLLLFRLMFLDRDSGWGFDPDSRLCAGLAELLAHAEEIGFLHCGEFSEACAELAALPQGTPLQRRQLALQETLDCLVDIWPEAYLGLQQPATPLYRRWMVRIHPQAQVAPDAVLEPGVRIRAGAVVEAGAIVRAGAQILAHVRIPAGVIIGPRAHIGQLELNGCSLPRGTVLYGDLLLHPGAWVRRHVEFGAHVEIGPGVTIPEGVCISSDAKIRRFFIGSRVRLPRGTQVEGDLRIDDHACIGANVRIGRNVCIEEGAVIGDDVYLPHYAVVRDGARVNMLALDFKAVLEPGVELCGDAALGAHTYIGSSAVLGAGVKIGAYVCVPAGVIIEDEARISMLSLNGTILPRGTRIAGNLKLGAGCRIGRHICFGADVELGAGIRLPGAIVIAPGARLRRLELNRSRLPPGTTLGGDLRLGLGVRVGMKLRFGADVQIGAGVALPDLVGIADGARIRRLSAPPGALPFGALLHGDLRLREGVVAGRDVVFHANVRIECACRIPDGLVFAQNAVVTRFWIAPDVRLPPGTVICGDLHLAPGVTVGANVVFGDGVRVGPDVAIPAGAQLEADALVTQIDIDASASLPARFALGGNVAIGSGARIGADADLGAGCRIGPGVSIPPGVHIAPGACVTRLLIAEDAALPSGTQIAGDLVLGWGASVGAGAALGADVRIGPHVLLPPGVVVLAGTRMRRLQAPPGALPPGTLLAGDLCIGAGADIGRDVCFGAGVCVGVLAHVGAGISLPAGTQVSPNAQVRALHIGQGASWPALAWIDGDLEVGDGAVIGEGVRFGAGVVIGAGAVIGPGVRLEAGSMVSAGAHYCAGALPRPDACAPLEVWADYFGSMPALEPEPAPASSGDGAESSAAVATAPFAPTPPIPIPPQVFLPRPHGWRID